MKTRLLALAVVLLLANWTADAGQIGYGSAPAGSNESVIFCGDNFNATTGYIGPALSGFFGGVWADSSINSAACQALDSTTEATADLPIATDYRPFIVNGFFCRLSSDPASNVVVTARSSTADLSPSLICTVTGAGSATSCTSSLIATPPVAAGATVDLKVVTLEDLSLQDIWCRMFITVQ